jgi:hypothetical protein
LIFHGTGPTLRASIRNTREAIMGNLTVDNLAIYALIGFGCLVAIMIGITAWVVRKAFSAPVTPPQVEPPKEQ